MTNSQCFFYSEPVAFSISLKELWGYDSTLKYFVEACSISMQYFAARNYSLMANIAGLQDISNILHSLQIRNISAVAAMSKRPWQFGGAKNKRKQVPVGTRKPIPLIINTFQVRIYSEMAMVRDRLFRKRRSYRPTSNNTTKPH